jgi:hypothetical protein
MKAFLCKNSRIFLSNLHDEILIMEFFFDIIFTASIQGMGTLPRQHPVVSMGGTLSMIPPPVSFLSNSYMGHPIIDSNNIPRSLSRGATNAQYYYG